MSAYPDQIRSGVVLSRKNLADYVAALEAENANLREVIQTARAELIELHDAMPEGVIRLRLMQILRPLALNALDAATPAAEEKA